MDSVLDGLAVALGQLMALQANVSVLRGALGRGPDTARIDTNLAGCLGGMQLAGAFLDRAIAELEVHRSADRVRP